MRIPEWNTGRPRVLVTDAWLANAGDGAIAIATERRLRRLVPEAAVLHAAYQGDLLADAYPELDLVPPLAGMLGVTPAIPEMAGWDSDACRRLVASADFLLIQGGGFAMQHYEPWERLRAWELAVELGVPIGFGPQSVGRFTNERDRDILARVFGAAAIVAVREHDSLANVVEMGAPAERVVVVPDEAVSLAPPEPRGRRRRGTACVVSAHAWLRPDGSVLAPAERLDRLVEMVRGLIQLGGRGGVTLLSTQQGLGKLGRGLEDDSEVAAALVATLSRREARRVRVLEGYLAPLEFAAIAGRHRGVVSMRMHPALLGLAGGIPTVLVSEAFKARGVLELLGHADVLVSRPEDAAQRLAELLAEPPIQMDRGRHARAGDVVIERLRESAAARERPRSAQGR